ncbi:MAG: glycerophosphodiester phosphodiesterase [Candidatus Taylorbacteria bacterium]|nr:glycerophosphodiester phosphodiesterase [Candidatus Taylorbacteria bacterium]
MRSLQSSLDKRAIMEILAHRGRVSPDKLGNTRSDFISCHLLGVDWVEADACLTADGEVIIYHPGSTRPDLSKMTWPEIERSILNVLDLNNFLTLLKAFRGIRCCLDIKQNSEELLRKLVETIIRMGMEDIVYLTAFQQKIRIPFISIESNANLLLRAKRIDSRIKTHLIANWPINLPKLAEQRHPDMISFGWLQEPIPIRVVSRNLFKLLVITRYFHDDIKKVKDMGIKVLGGIVNDVDSMRYLADLGVEGIMTDDATLGMTFKKEFEATNG